MEYVEISEAVRNIFVLPCLSFISTDGAGRNCCISPGARQTDIEVGYINYDGFIVQENGGYIDGYGVAFLDKISEYTGWRYEFYYNTWEECLNELERGTIDLVSRPEQAGQEGPVRVYGVSNRA